MNSDRFDDVSFPSTGGVRLQLSGSVGEVTAVTALQPISLGDDGNTPADWLVQVKEVVFTSDSATVVFDE